MKLVADRLDRISPSLTIAMTAKARALTTRVVWNSRSVCSPRAVRSTTKHTRRKRRVWSRR